MRFRNLFTSLIFIKLSIITNINTRLQLNFLNLMIDESIKEAVTYHQIHTPGVYKQ